MKVRTRLLAASVIAGLLMSSTAALARDHEGRGSDESRTPLTAEQVTCVKTAVETRETAVHTAFTAFATSMGTAYTTRHTALVTAWGNTDKEVRKTAIKDAWKAFKDSAKTAKRTFTKARKDTWKAFKTAAQTCNVPTSNSGESEGADTL